MPFPIGNLTATKAPIFSATLSVAHPDEVVAIVDCHPPPKGSVQRLNPTLKFVPLFSRLQASEVRRIVQAAGRPTIDNPPTRRNRIQVVDMIIDELQVPEKLEVDLAKIEPTWWTPVRCYETRILLRVFYRSEEVTCRANATVTDAGETFPAGDVIASFRVKVPMACKFIRTYRWNPSCCPSDPQTHAQDDGAVMTDMPGDWIECQPGTISELVHVEWDHCNPDGYLLPPIIELDPPQEGD